MDLFIYDWLLSDTLDTVQAYAIDTSGATCVIHFHEFFPWVHIEVCGQELSHSNAKLILNVLKTNYSVLKACRVTRTLLYGSAMSTEPKQMFVIRFGNFKKLSSFSWCIKNTGGVLKVPSVGREFKVKVYDTQANPILQFCTEANIAPTGWIQVYRAVTNNNIVNVHAKNVRAHASPPSLPVPRVLSFDIETFSSNPDRMPDAKILEDRVFQIAICMSTGRKVLLTLWTGPLPQEAHGFEVQTYNTEADLIIGFAKAVVELDPHIITGYNIFKFDVPYLIQRAKTNYVFTEFLEQGVHGVPAKEKTIKWSSAAFSSQEFQFLDIPGRITLDMLTVVQRDFKLDNYRLKTVAKHFIGDTKDPITPQGIFASYGLLVHSRENPTDNRAKSAAHYAIMKVGKYCVQDADLVLRLFNHLQTFVGCTELSSVMNVPISVLFTRGQQIRMYSQVFRQCYHEKPRRVINRERDEASGKMGKYEGAYVFEHKPGVYDNVVSLDFNSLYPSTQLAYNICPSTYVEPDDPRPDSECHVIDISSHIGCKHDSNTARRSTVKTSDTVCSNAKARFVRTPEGVLPRLLRELLEARAATRRRLKEVKDNPGLAEVLDKRQLALKISANSVYGSMGAAQGYIPFLVGAAATTSAGRMNISKAACAISEKYGGALIYGDTDSVYVQFPQHESSPQVLWDYCLRVEKEVSAIFPPPMYLAFEEAIYKRYAIFSKKRYIATKADRDGNVSSKLTVRGIVLTRRDNAQTTRILYKDIVMAIFERATLQEIQNMAVDYVNRMLTRCLSPQEYVITKSVKEPSEYVVRPLPLDTRKRLARLAELGCASEAEYKVKALPAHIQLMVRMRSRGTVVDAGQRIEYVVVHPHLATPLAAKLEDIVYFQQHSDVLRIDPVYYIKLMANPIDQVTQIIFNKPVIKPLLETVVAKRNMHAQLLARLVQVKVAKNERVLAVNQHSWVL